jgi:hypothetical protein
MFSDHFNILILKIFFKKIKKYYFNIPFSKKYFKKQPKQHYLSKVTLTKMTCIYIYIYIYLPPKKGVQEKAFLPYFL